MLRCDYCQMMRATIYYPTMRKKLCENCFITERQTIKSLIRSMPDVENKPAPLGHRFWRNDCVADEAKGKAWVNQLYQLYRTGTVH